MKNKPKSLQDIKAKRQPHRNVNEDLMKDISTLDRFALWITNKVGTIGFFLIIFLWSVLWLLWNTIAPINFRFDPAPAFVAWLFISNLLQILLMPLILLGQNLQGKHSEVRAEYDHQINLKNEEEIEVILEHLEYQNKILLKLVEKYNIDLDN